ncbi:MAG: hypothetical protein QG625_2113, partial [Cyanobacteriota bacterium erpe_2018_sw_39hr_WHONDRS-SW48-000098_B_bin.30]|nr:hypothetical protein [Cyanobacteriota bacterium erpe_2018_sw_39hr_WHONDRS-SW48-000098_B_bin.30]
GEMIKAHRAQKDLTQEQLAATCTRSKSRTQIALLEQGRRVPDASELKNICEFISVPEKYWQKFAEVGYDKVVAFEEAIGELVGRPIDLSHLEDTSEAVAIEKIKKIFQADLTNKQAFDWLNSLLVFYDVQPLVTWCFFERYITADAFKSPESLLQVVRTYQTDSIRLFNSFSAAYAALNSSSSFTEILAPLRLLDDDEYRKRLEWDQIEIIENKNLPNLGYIAANRLKQERSERTQVCGFLRNLAKDIREQGASALLSIGEKRKRKMDTLLRQFNTTLPHGFMSQLFAATPDELEREASFLSPKDDTNLALIESTQEMGLRNLSRYLGSDYLDVYVATSMRAESDFISVNSFVTELFAQPEIRPLKLRYFNPTQSWIEDRVAKGLVEALMLRRARYTIYMAQNSDSFGKDSEASVALGQGQAVIVYVPKLVVPELSIDSQQMAALSKEELLKLATIEGTAEDKEVLDDTVDSQDIFSKVLEIKLRKATPAVFAKIAVKHWADFSLYDEAKRIKPEENAALFRGWLDRLLSGHFEPVPKELVLDFTNILIALAIGFEKRSEVFREIHPLALQVILSSGVLNGMIVVRSVESCSDILKSLIVNKLKLSLEVDEHNYRLVETTTRSTIRVISRHSLIGSAFSTHYAQVLKSGQLTVETQQF